MDKNNEGIKEIQIELNEEMAQGNYANMAIIAHSNSEFVIDFVRMLPGIQKAKVQSRIIMTPDNAERLLLTLQDNLIKYKQQLKGIDPGTAYFDDSLPKAEA